VQLSYKIPTGWFRCVSRDILQIERIDRHHIKTGEIAVLMCQSAENSAVLGDRFIPAEISDYSLFLKALKNLQGRRLEGR
jgi:hypothetical protein